MRKKSQEELGTLVTREMKVMLQDESLTKEQRFDVLAAVMFDTPIKNSILASFAKSLKAGFELVNAARYRGIEREREWRKNAERKRRKLSYLADEHVTPSNSMSLHEHPCHSMSLHDGLKQNRTEQGISPYKPPKGGERKVPKAVEPEDIVAKQTGRCKHMDAEGFCTNGENQGGGFKCFDCDRREPVAGGVRTATLDEPCKFADSDFRDASKYIAQAIEDTEAFARMRVNRRNLMRYLIPILKKNCAAEDANKVDYKKAEALGRTILNGLDAWTAAWKADDWQYAPGKITKWLADEKYLQPPRKKAAAPESVGSGCGDCGAEIA